MLADGTLDVFIADLLEAKLRLIHAVEADVAPNASVLDELYEKLRTLGPALLQENKALQATGEIRDRLELVYRVTFGRAGHLECSCEGFRWRENCRHVRKVRGI